MVGLGEKAGRWWRGFSVAWLMVLLFLLALAGLIGSLVLGQMVSGTLSLWLQRGSLLCLLGLAFLHLRDKQASRKRWQALKEPDFVRLINAMEEGLVIFDAEDRLVICNERARQIFDVMNPTMVPGARFEEILRYGFDHGLVDLRQSDPEHVIAWRMQHHRREQTDLEYRLTSGRWIREYEKQLKNGWRILVSIDITALKRHDTILSAVSRAAEYLLTGGNWKAALPRVLAELSQAAGVDRSYVYRCQAAPDGDVAARQILGWMTPWLSEDQVLPPAPEHFLFDKFHLTRWKEELSAGHDITCRIADLPEDEQRPFSGVDIEALCMLPIFDETNWWGFIGFHRSSKSGGPWLPEEAEALSIGLRILSAAIRRESAETALVEARDKAQRASKVKSDFLAMISHEIRTPMNGIIAALSLLDEDRLDEEQRQLAHTARDSAEDLMGIISDILDLTALKSGQKDVELSSFSLRKLAEDALSEFVTRANVKKIGLACCVAHDLPQKVIGDRNRLHQSLSRLVSNAVKFTHSGGVGLCVSLASDAPQVSGRVVVDFDIVDSGIGLTQDQKEKLFQLFATGQSGSKRQYGGTGLGLKIVSDLVDIMGGQVSLPETSPQGSRFRIRLSLDIRNSATGETAPLHTYRIAILDPVAITRNCHDQQLKSWGAETLLLEQAEQIKDLTPPCDALIVESAALWPRRKSTPKHKTEEAASLLSPAPCPVLILLEARHLQLADRLSQALPNAVFLPQPVAGEQLLSHLLSLKKQTSSPMNKPLPERLATAEEPHRWINRCSHILLAEDSSTNQMLTTALLERMGYQLDLAENGRQALSLVRTGCYDAILMDIAMPEMDGVEACRAIRALTSKDECGRIRGQVPIIALTANIYGEDRHRYLEAGMNDVLAKPINRAELLESLARFLGPTPIAEAGQLTDSGRKPAKQHEAETLNVDVLQTLCQDLDPETVQRLVRGFIMDMQQQMANLQTARKEDDLKSFARYCHSIKGAAASFGALALSEAAREAEHCAAQALEKGASGEEAAYHLASTFPPLVEQAYLRLEAWLKKKGGDAQAAE